VWAALWRRGSQVPQLAHWLQVVAKSQVARPETYSAKRRMSAFSKDG
jgi:hypothetical protein